MDDMRNRYRASRRDYSTPAYNRPIQPGRPSPEPTTVPTRPAPVPAPAAEPGHRPAAHHLHRPESHRPETLLAEPQPAYRAQPAHKPHRTARKSRRGLKRAVIAVAVLVVIGAAAVLVLPKNSTPKNPFSQSIKSAANFNLYYPAQLPDGYIIKSSSIQLKDSVLTYAATRADLRIVFTIQAVPANFNFQVFYQQYLKNTQQFHTVYGKAVMGNVQDRVLSSMTDGKTWFILSDNSPNVSGGELRLIMDSLKQY